MLERICPDCEISIAHLHYRAKRCKHCVWLIKIDYTRNYHKKQRIIAQEKKKLEPRLCLCCNKCIAHTHYQTKYCKKCIEERKLKRDSDRYYREKKLSLKKRFCPDCETCITNRHGGAKRCKKCAKEEIIRTKPIYMSKYLKKKFKHVKKEKKQKNCLDCETCITELHWQSKRCKKCAAEESKKKCRIRNVRYRQDPKYRSIEAAESKKRKDILMSTPEGRKKKRASNRKYYSNMISTPEGRAIIFARRKQRNKENYVSVVRSRLKRMKRQEEPKGLLPVPTKQEYYDYQCGICPLTGISMKGIPFKDLHMDHIVPLINGGKTEANNLCLTIGRANQSKGRKSLLVWMASSLYKPMVERCICKNTPDISKTKQKDLK